VPPRRDRPRARGARVHERTPGESLLLHHFLELLRAAAAGVDPDEREGLVLQSLHERPLVGPLRPSRQSDMAPEVEQHHLAAIVPEPEALAVLVLAFDVRCLLADTQAANLEQCRPGPPRDGVAAGELHVAVLLRGLLEGGFDLLHGLAAI